MTPEQRKEIIRLAEEWSLASHARGISVGAPDLAEIDRNAGRAFYEYMEGLAK